MTPTQGQPIHIPARTASDTTTFCLVQPTVVVFPSDVATAEQMNLVQVSGILDFWDDDAENLYKPEDGQPI
jgi:hypothetical protein